MYSNHSIQIKYRRKIYELVAGLAYRNVNEEQFKWLPETVVSLMGEHDASAELSSDLDYASEACHAALNLNPQSYKDAMGGSTIEALKAVEEDNEGGHSNLCALKSVCRKCAQTMGSVRHCATVCPTGAISVDNMGSTYIDQEKCVSCGKCMLACPYGAIIDKSCIYQVIQSIKGSGEVYALLCPGLHEQFSAGSEAAEDLVSQAEAHREPCGAATVTHADGTVSDFADIWSANEATEAGETIVLQEDVVLDESRALCLEGKILDLAGYSMTLRGEGIELKDSVIRNGNIRIASANEPASAAREIPVAAASRDANGSVFFDDDAITEAFRLLGFADTYQLKEVGKGLLADCQYDMWRSTQTKAHRICEISNLPAINREIRIAVSELKQQNPDCKIALICACTRSKLVFERAKGLHVDYVLDYEEVVGMMNARGISNDAITLKVGNKDKENLKIID